VKEIHTGNLTEGKIENLISRVNNIKATGAWTDLEKALEYANTKTEFSTKKVIYVFTDGLDDPPKGKKKTPIAVLLNKIFEKFKTNGNFVYIIDMTGKNVDGETVVNPGDVDVDKEENIEKIKQAAVYTVYGVGVVIFVILMIALIIERNRRLGNMKNIYKLCRYNDTNSIPTKSSPRTKTAGVNLNFDIFFIQNRIDIKKKFPNYADNLNIKDLVIQKTFTGSYLITGNKKTLIVDGVGRDTDKNKWRIIPDVFFSLESIKMYYLKITQK
jgi:hypothetical protein